MAPTVFEGLAQTESRPAERWWREISDQGIPRCAPDALPETVGHTGEKDPSHGRRQGKNRLGQRGQNVARHRQRLSCLEPITEDA